MRPANRQIALKFAIILSWGKIKSCDNAALSWMVSFLRSNAENVTASDNKNVAGDANCDGIVDIADIVLVKSWLLNSEKYTISEQGIKNADVESTGNGINSNDAVAIQQFVLKLLDKLPIQK